MNPLYDYKTLSDKTKRAILLRDSYRCRVCKSNRNTEIHHITPYVECADDSESNLVTLCNRCHDKFEGFKEHLILVLAGQMTLWDFEKLRPSLKRIYRNEMGAPAKYRNGEKSRAIKVPLTEAEHERILSTITPLQRAVALLNLCDDVDAVTKGQPK